MRSFVIATDPQVSDFLNTDPTAHNWLASKPLGYVVTLFFSDAKAQFVLVSVDKNGKQTWVWNKKAWNKAGEPIDRNGNVIQNQNIGGTGAGSAEVPGFGAGAGSSFGVAGMGSCTSVTTITVNGEATDYVYVHPC